MRLKNTTNSYLPLGTAFLAPYGITSDLAQEDIEKSHDIKYRKSIGHLVEYTGPAPVKKPAAKVDVRYEVDPVVVNGKLVTDPRSTKTPVQYVVADSEGVDGVSMDGGDSVHSLGKSYHQSPDFIETGVDAGKFKNGADAFEAELNKEVDESTFDDEETLSENESERPEGQDADEAIREDATQFLRNQGKNGAEVTTAKNMIEQSVTSATAKINQTLSENLDNGEAAPNASHKVTEFLKQPLNAKKFMIAKETDSTFLKEVDTVSGSDTIKQLVQQRLQEIK